MQILLATEVYFIHRIKKEKQSLEVEDGEAVRWSTGLAPGRQGKSWQRSRTQNGSEGKADSS